MTVRAAIGKDFARYLPIFLVFFVIGIAGGRAAGMVFQNTTPGEKEALVSREMGNSQRNLLVLIVDNIQSPRSRLEGVWLLITAADTHQLILVPVYPGQANWSEPLKSNFALTDELQPTTGFLDLLTDMVLWDHYLLIDRDGINSILATTGQYKRQASDTSISNANNDADQLTLEEQTSLWGSICTSIAGIIDRDELEAYFYRISQLVTTDLPWSDSTLLSLGGTGAGEQITCEFPTLDLVSH
jgi:hypothetical protein